MYGPTGSIPEGSRSRTIPAHAPLNQSKADLEMVASVLYTPVGVRFKK